LVGKRPMRIWSAVPSNDMPPYRAVSSTFLWGYTLINEQLPRLTSDQVRSIPASVRHIQLVSDPAQAEAGRAELKRAGIDSVVVAQSYFGRAGNKILVVVADIVRRT